MKSITHRDQVHGDVRYDPLSVALLDIPQLQRLGRVYQLGFTHLVYRGGTHTRLSHVMGAASVADALVDNLRQNYRAKRELPRGAIPVSDFLPGKGSDEDRWDALKHLVRWAALLHDLGHVPCGHTLEDEFDGIYVKHDDFASPRIPFLWNETEPGRTSPLRAVFERDQLLPDSFRPLGISGDSARKTVMLIVLHKEQGSGTEKKSFAAVLDEHLGAPGESDPSRAFVKTIREALASQTKVGLFHPYMADIVGNTICADYLDYVRRDPVNVGLDVMRDNRVLSHFYVGRDSHAELRMALALTDGRGKPRLDTCTGVVELVRQRFRFAEIIYYHKTKVAASVMLAKVFALIGKPSEVDAERREIRLNNIERIASDVSKGGRAAAVALRTACMPASLMDPDLGDESLLLWLQDRAFARLEDAAGANDSARCEACVRAVSLLQALVRRRLYKVALSLDSDAFGAIRGGSDIPDEIERRIRSFMTRVRKDPHERATLEARMAAAAAWPADTLLLYVPPRKSQAKGIETGALHNGDVITLGSHSAVRDQVEILSKGYKSLWRLLLLVHPDKHGDALGLSKAADELARYIIEDRAAGTSATDPKDLTSGAIGKISGAAWFPYVEPSRRPAAEEYAALVRDRVDWKAFEKALGPGDPMVGPAEYADRAYLIANGQLDPSVVRRTFQESGSLTRRIEGASSGLTVEGREGADPLDKRRTALDAIAAGLRGTGPDARQLEGSFELASDKPRGRRRSRDR